MRGSTLAAALMLAAAGPAPADSPKQAPSDGAPPAGLQAVCTGDGGLAAMARCLATAFGFRPLPPEPRQGGMCRKHGDPEDLTELPPLV